MQHHLRKYWLTHICHIDSLILSVIFPVHDTLSRQTMGPHHATYERRNALDRAVSGCYLCCSMKPCLPQPRTIAYGNRRDMHWLLPAETEPWRWVHFSLPELCCCSVNSYRSVHYICLQNLKLKAAETKQTLFPVYFTVTRKSERGN